MNFWYKLYEKSYYPGDTTYYTRNKDGKLRVQTNAKENLEFNIKLQCKFCGKNGIECKCDDIKCGHMRFYKTTFF